MRWHVDAPDWYWPILVLISSSFALGTWNTFFPGCLCGSVWLMAPGRGVLLPCPVVILCSQC